MAPRNANTTPVVIRLSCSAIERALLSFRVTALCHDLSQGPTGFDTALQQIHRDRTVTL